MSRRLIIIVTTVAAFEIVAPTASARTITVDGSVSDWDEATSEMDPPGQSNVGHVGRDPSEEGEWIWRDAAGDERTDFATPDGRVDLTELRITG
ncbi:MAG: hypothetical protein HYY06_01080, partial [Deltaproteobacteria bacterium]|nr:hypothetical protein [Deltaproteobacteria bacterium]